MKQLAASLLLLCAMASPVCAQQQAGLPSNPQLEAPAPEAKVFRVHIADGRTGDAIAGAHVQLWYDEAAGAGYAVATGQQGDALMPKPVGEPLRVLVSVSGYTDCRKLDRDMPAEGYNLASIAEKGVSARNTCSRIALRTSPGELVLYVRPSHWYENLNKNPS